MKNKIHVLQMLFRCVPRNVSIAKTDSPNARTEARRLNKLPAHHLCLDCPCSYHEEIRGLIFIVLTTEIIQTNAIKRVVETQIRHWRQKRARAKKRLRNLHIIKRIEPLKSGISTLNGKTLFLGLFTKMAKRYCK